MAVLRLQIEVDSEVQPELHAMLLSTAAAGHGERLRQLAASGLVWERLRLQSHALAQQWVLQQALPAAADAVDGNGAAAVAGSALAAATPETAATPAASDAALVQASAAATATASVDPAAAASAAPDAVVAVEHGGGAPPPADGTATDAVAPVPDLALLLSVPQADPTAAEMFLREMRNAVQELPVLTEVVGDELLPPRRAGAGRDRAVPAPGGMTEDPLQPAAEPALAEAHEEPDAQMPPPPQPAKRSRLLRMQEKGLFRNE